MRPGQGVTRIIENYYTFGLDKENLANPLQIFFPDEALSDKQAEKLAEDFLESQIEVEQFAWVRATSVDVFEVRSAFCQVWGD